MVEYNKTCIYCESVHSTEMAEWFNIHDSWILTQDVHPTRLPAGSHVLSHRQKTPGVAVNELCYTV